MKTLQVPSQVYAANTYIQDIPTNVAKRFIGAHVNLSRESWLAGVNYDTAGGTTIANIACVAILEKSLDNGSNWLFVSEFTAPGGDIFGGKTGDVLLTNSAFSISFTDPTNGQPFAQVADLRLRFIVLRSIRTAITADLFEVGDVVTAAKVK